MVENFRANVLKYFKNFFSVPKQEVAFEHDELRFLKIFWLHNLYLNLDYKCQSMDLISLCACRQPCITMLEIQFTFLTRPKAKSTFPSADQLHPLVRGATF